YHPCQKEFRERAPSWKDTTPIYLLIQAGTDQVQKTAPASKRALSECALQFGEEFLRPLQSLFHVVMRYGIGETQVMLRAEGLARNRDHMRLMQQTPSQLHRSLRARLAQIRRHVGIHVERAFRPGAGDARNLRQPRQDA